MELLKLFVDFEYYFHVITSFTNVFLPFCVLSFSFAYGFLSCERAFELNLVLFAYACFYFLFFKIQLKKYVTVIYVKEHPAYVSLYEFCNI